LFKGVGNTVLTRDESYPIRCTVQFYKVTDTSEIPEEEFKSMNDTINELYQSGKAKGSLVTETTNRVTETKDVSLLQKISKPMMSFFSKKFTCGKV
jgi:hypothetical protein